MRTRRRDGLELNSLGVPNAVDHLFPSSCKLPPRCTNLSQVHAGLLTDTRIACMIVTWWAKWGGPSLYMESVRANAAYDAGETTEKLQVAESHWTVVESSKARARAVGEWVESWVMIKAYE